jgi:hypothetical protein
MMVRKMQNERGDTTSIGSVIRRYARTWSLLLQYDEDRLERPQNLPSDLVPEIAELPGDLSELARIIEEHAPGKGVEVPLAIAQRFWGHMSSVITRTPSGGRQGTAVAFNSMRSGYRFRRLPARSVQVKDGSGIFSVDHRKTTGSCRCFECMHFLSGRHRSGVNLFPSL